MDTNLVIGILGPTVVQWWKPDHIIQFIFLPVSSHHIPFSCLLPSSLGSRIPIWRSSFIPNIEWNLLNCCFHLLAPVYLTPLTRFIRVILHLNIHFPTALVRARGGECQIQAGRGRWDFGRRRVCSSTNFFSSCYASCQKGKTGFK